MAKAKKRNVRINDILIGMNAIQAEELAEAEASAKAAGIRLEKHLVEKSLVSHADMALAISEYLRMPPIGLEHFKPDAELLDLVPAEVFVKNLAIPVARAGKCLSVAMGDPFNIMAVDELQALTGYEIMPLVASELEITQALERCFSSRTGAEDINIEEILQEADEDLEISHESGEESDESIDAIVEDSESAPVVRMVSMILVEALRQGASDIHFEPQEKRVCLRYRIDGALVEMPSPPKNLQGAVISRMKIMSGMDIAERRIPQDGRIKVRALGKEVDLRVNTLPTIFGEKIVMRVLDKSALFPNLAALGLDEDAYKAMSHAIAQPNGMILVTGPTGSGKTTTLYSCLFELNRPDVNIITCEEPVEYQLGGINQVHINPHVGLTFATALREVLRQSPDIILVGETRDGETAEISIKAALTGHLVLTTLHTNDAAGAITRMTDMGVQPSLLASALICAQAQRLLRRLCTSCRKPAKDIPVDMLKAYDIDPAYFEGATIYEQKGCYKCHDTGYKGRASIMEVLAVDGDIRRDIVSGVPAGEIAAKAVKKGMLTLKDIGMRKVKEGLTSIDAALKVTGGGE